MGSSPRQKNKDKEEKDAKILFDNDGKGVKRQCKNDAEKVSLLDEVSEKVQFNPSLHLIDDSRVKKQYDRYKNMMNKKKRNKNVSRKNKPTSKNTMI